MTTISKDAKLVMLVNVFTVEPANQSPSPDSPLVSIQRIELSERGLP